MIQKPDTCGGCPLYEKPYGKKTGFSFPTGTGKNGVMVVAEALGKDEEQVGKALVGASGYTLFQQLKRIDIEREDFTLFNVLACRPPDNKLVGEPYERAAISHCAPNLDAAIHQAKAVAKSEGRTFTIVTLGKTAFMRVLGLDYKRHADLLKKDYYAYPFWSDTYQCWVFNAPHPAYLLRGKTHLWPVIQFVFKRALEVAAGGLVLDEPDYLLDPSTTSFDRWILEYADTLVLFPDNPLSYDIETPYKKKVKDEEEIGKEEDADHTIIRIGFSYQNPATGRFHTCSVKFSAEFMAGIERLFSLALYVLGWNSDHYDYPRVSRHVEVAGIGLDGMQAWHILNSTLPKSLGFVTPYYCQNTLMWKHLADTQPAFYNAKDAHMALVNWFGIRRDLEANNLWHVYQRHWIELHKALKFMTGTGVLRDNDMRSTAEAQMTNILVTIEAQMEEAVPQDARKLKVYKKTPKDTSGMIQIDGELKVNTCPKCGEIKPLKAHGKLCDGVREKLPYPVKLWALPLAFKVSKLGLTNYQKSLRHQAIINRREHKVTFDADAITLLIKRYPRDPLYPKILEHRKVQKLLGTYVGVTLANGRQEGGMQIGKDGRIHTQYGRDANTLRFTSQDPNLQNLPRPNPKDIADLANIIRNLIIAAPGHILYARDFSGIEAVLTGYFALDPSYIRIAKRDVHTYYTVYALYELEGGARIKSVDLPDLSWPDDRLFPHLEALKAQFKHERNSLYKHLVHAANFMQGAKGAQAKIFSETGIEYDVKIVQKVMDVYYTLFPKIKQWHRNVLAEAEKDGFLRNPFDYVCRFNRVYDYKKEMGEWVKKPGADANRVVAFKPQSTAVAIITEAILRLFYGRFEEAGQWLRLQVHDELLLEIPVNLWQAVDQVVLEEMERPIPQLRLPSSWGMGDSLSILTEAKVDLKSPSRWGSMKGI